MKFIEEYACKSWTLVELARRHGISRKTAYKYLERFREEGVGGLQDRSRARHGQDHQTPWSIERRALAMKRRYPYWGPRKIRCVLERRFPEVEWPAKSTLGDIFKRHGLVQARKKRRHVVPSSSLLAPASEPNDLWCTDFKGHLLSGARERLEPFTLGDAFSRYSLACTLVPTLGFRSVWPVVERALREHGLPKRFRSDNGAPFATAGLGGLSELAVRLIRLGVRPERIAPGKPQQNGCQERFHLTLELEAMSPPAATARQQQKILESFRRRFNEERPHEALGDRTPAEVYRPSPRPYPRRIPEPEYPAHMVVRAVTRKGGIRWRCHEIFLSETLARQKVALCQTSSTHWSIRFGPVEVAVYDEEFDALLPHDRLIWLDDEQNA